MLPRLKTLVGPATTVVPALNGLPWWYFYKEGGAFDGGRIDCLDPKGEMFAALSPAHILGCVVHAAAEVTGPGVVKHTAGRTFVLGEPDRTVSARARRLAEVMNAAGFDARVAADIRVEVWTKLIGNLSYNPVAALALATMDDINSNEALLALIKSMMGEAMRVAGAYGVRVPMTVDERVGIAKKLSGARISMHQDVEKGRPLETDAIVGAVIELARQAPRPVGRRYPRSEWARNSAAVKTSTAPAWCAAASGTGTNSSSVEIPSVICRAIAPSRKSAAILARRGDSPRRTRHQVHGVRNASSQAISR